MINQQILDTVCKLAEVLPLEKYKQGKAKSFTQLVTEIAEGESEIIWQNETPIRIIKVARVDVLFGNKFLRETNQKFSDGRSRQRNYRGVSEKFIPGESAEQAAKRGIKEELGINPEELEFSFVKTEVEEKPSPSYPGLMTHLHYSDYFVSLPQKFYRDLYIAHEGDCTTYFTWEENGSTLLANQKLLDQIKQSFEFLNELTDEKFALLVQDSFKWVLNKQITGIFQEIHTETGSSAKDISEYVFFELAERWAIAKAKLEESEKL